MLVIFMYCYIFLESICKSFICLSMEIKKCEVLLDIKWVLLIKLKDLKLVC